MELNKEQNSKKKEVGMGTKNIKVNIKGRPNIKVNIKGRPTIKKYEPIKFKPIANRPLGKPTLIKDAVKSAVNAGLPDREIQALKKLFKK